MPKVTEEYVKEKKKSIVNAAINACLKKTMITVTMQDIINESKLSQGGIYRFYKNVDEIFKDMLIFLNEQIDFKSQVDNIFSENLKHKETIIGIFDILINHFNEEFIKYNKLGFEFNLLAMNYPQRAKNILDINIKESSFKYLNKKVFEYIIYETKMGNIKPIIKVEQVLAFITASYDGIQMDGALMNTFKDYSENNTSSYFKVQELLKILCSTTLYLLGL